MTESVEAFIFCQPDAPPFEDWGLVTSLRVYYEDGLEVEYGLTSSEWAEEPIDEGTYRVIRDGMGIYSDREGLLGRALEIVQG